MGLGSWVKSLLKKERHETDKATLETVSILRTETPEKIVETRIKPIKIPTIIDIGERLGLISRDIFDIKQDMVSKSWFKSEYESDGARILEKLEKIESRLNNLHYLLNQLNDFTKYFTKDLSNFTKPLLKPKTLSILEEICNLIKDRKRIRYKDITKVIPISDPTLSKYLKELVSRKKIKRIKTGKAVYYEIFS